jgi:hypothetical protein
MKEHSEDWRTPLLLAGAGLVLMIGGWKASTYVPMSPREADNARQLEELRVIARRTEKDAANPGQEKLSERLGRVEVGSGTPPYELPGRLAFFAGLLMFIGAGILMYQKKPAAETPAEEEEKAEG